MKKMLAGFVLAALMMIAVPFAADAQTCRVNRRSYRNRAVSQRYYASNRSYNRGYNRGYYAARNERRPSFYRRHRNLINIGIGTGGGALIGALVGGRRGALIGTGVGAGSSALYTYVLNKKKRRYRNY